MADKKTCEQCGGVIPASAPGCPACLLAAGLDTPFDAATEVLDSGLGLVDPSADRLASEGTVIGPYTLVQQIGEGGFGEVYWAEQVEPLKRQVALKIIKPGMDSKQVIARIEAERQALALMDHPHIARVLAAGLPYFVMELVVGLD